MLAAPGQHDAERAAGDLGVGEEQLVEIPHAVEQEAVGVRRLDLDVLRHHRRGAGDVGRGRGGSGLARARVGLEEAALGGAGLHGGSLAEGGRGRSPYGPAKTGDRGIERPIAVEPSPADRQFASSPDAEILPPSIVCTKGAPRAGTRCPNDGQELLADEMVADDESAYLTCPECNSKFPLTETSLQEILAASVQCDSACGECAFQELDVHACLSQATLLNLLPARVLVFKSWDLDLRDYLRWQQGLTAPQHREEVWARLEEQHRHTRSTALSPELAGENPGEEAQHLWDIVTLFVKILDAVEQLHRAAWPS